MKTASLPVHALSLFFGIFLAGDCLAGPLEDGRAAFARQEYEAALAHFSAATGTGHAAALFYRARMLELGLGVPVDQSTAFSLYRQAADEGFAPAINRVALMFYRGENGLARDPKQALLEFARAEKKGDANATFNLGKLYFEGEGTARDMARALALYTNAAERGSVLALNTMGALLRQSAPEKSHSYFARSAARGNAVGLYETGLSFLHEGARSENLRSAHKYFNLAAARGHAKAAEVLQALTAVMTPQDVQTAQAAARDFQPEESLTDE